MTTDPSSVRIRHVPRSWETHPADATVPALRLRDRRATPPPAAGPATAPSRLWPWRRVLLGTVLGFAAAVAVYLVWRPVGATAANNVSNVAQALAAALAAGAAARAGQRSRGGPRIGWLALAVGELGWVFGQTIVAGMQWAGGEAPFPGLPDVGFLLFPAGCLICLLLLQGRRPGVRAGRDVLDGLIIVVALLLASWATSLTQVLAQHQDSALATAVAAAYPLADVALGAAALIRLTRATGQRATLLGLVAGLGLLTVSDTAWTYLSTASVADQWQWTCAFWVAGFGVLAVAAVAAGAPEGKGPGSLSGGRHTRSSWQLALPYASAGFAMVVVAGRALLGGSPAPVLLAGLLALVVAVLGRQFLALLEVHRLSAQLEHQAFHDPLTGLANRALFLDRLEHALRTFDAELRPIAVLFIDLDGFKTINDTLGHPAGDRVLVEVAARLRACISPAHSVARLGGDEFAVLLEGASVDPWEVAAGVQSALRPAFPLDGQNLRLRASIGLAGIDTADTGLDATELLRRADVALYVAKDSGKDVVRGYRPDLLAALPGGSAGMASDLAAAIEDGQLHVAYQPIVDPWTGGVVSVEALARWTHPVRGPVSPAEFIPLAVQTGLLRPLTAVVLDAALATAARWRALGDLQQVPVAVNFDPSALRDADLIPVLLAAAARHGLPPQALTVEITETAPLEDLTEATATVRALQAAGFGVAIDDFGAGATSMAYLHELTADVIKIDRSLILAPDALRSGGLVDTIMALTRALGRRSVVEGVETAEQADALLALGCSAIQGFLYSRPVPAEELLGTLTAAEPFTAERSAPAGR